MPYSVVIIDDDRLIIEGIKSSFNWQKYNFEVTHTFRDPISFFEYLKSGNHVDVAFCDIKMPKMNGLMLIEKIRCELDMSSPLFVILSAYDDYKYMRKAINIGVIDYCLKPIDKNETDAILEKALAKLLPQEKPDNSHNNKDFAMLINYINTHYHEKITLEQLSQKFFFNSNYLCLLFKKNLNMTFSNYLKKVRMEKAAELLLEGKYNMHTIAEKTGYPDYSYFNKSFHSYYGKTPVSFLKQHSSKQGGD